MDRLVPGKLAAHLQKSGAPGAAAAGQMEKDMRTKIKNDLRWIAVRLLWAGYGIAVTLILQNLIATAR